MRRCDRHSCTRTDPYSEFSFEKSLRKYEHPPHKKVKENNTSVSRPITTGQYQPMKPEIVLTASRNQQPIAKQQCNLGKEQMEAEQVCMQAAGNIPQKLEFEYQIKQIQATGLLNQCEEKEVVCVNSNEVSNTQLQKQTCLYDQYKQESMQNKHSEQAQDQTVLKLAIENEVNNDDLAAIINPTSLTIQDFQQVSIAQEGEQPADTEPKKCKMREGRLNLTQKMSVSLRTLNRFRQKGVGNKEIIQKFMKTRNLGSEEGVEVAGRLKHFLQLNQ